jgi:hypothetical protein
MIHFLVALALQAAPAPPPDPCQVDERALMDMGFNAFDQDMQGGWRALSQRPGCEARAADLIHTYRVLAEHRMSILYWHEGQLRAALGQTEEAIRLFEQSRKPDDQYGWNPYVDATIAFLRGDREALIAARGRLAALPRPAGFEERTLPGGFRTTWPLNLQVVDGLIRCFGRTYREAYGGAPECRGEAAQR